MARSTTTFKEGNKGKPKGAKHNRTKLKEAFGVKNWNDLKTFVENEGLEKLTAEMAKLKGANYAYVFLTLCEFVKPKQQRTVIAGDNENPLTVHAAITALPLDLRKQILEQLRKNT